MSDFAYDDERCPERAAGLNHIREAGRITCEYCGCTVYKASLRRSEKSCELDICKGDVTIRTFLDVTLADGTVDRQAVWLCISDSAYVKAVVRRPSVTLRRAPEGFVWLDAIELILFTK